MRKGFSRKPIMNTLLNIDNYFGEYSSPLTPWLIFFGVGSIPLFIWLFIFQLRLPWLPVVLFEVLLWLPVVATYSFLDVNRIVQDYLKARFDAYAIADDIVHVKFQHEDGLTEFDNGQVMYLLVGHLKEYIKDSKLSVSLEQFMDELDSWDWDYILQNDVDEITLASNIDKCIRYTDKQVISERIAQYNYQDEWARNNTGVYKIIFVVLVNKSSWRSAKERLNDIVTSKVADCFNEIYIANREQVNDIMSRDLCMYIDINQMLLNKFNSLDIGSSRMMWYDDEVPKELTKSGETFTVGLEERRASLDDNEG